ncbi:CLUMA_CG002907, isoform A [Clunio marinus]|uniref:CLUMA_CG002907, isoform A n=1 Tax=Clunio marinus TaxID=568069 RepID=A0A1J1HNN6_9DIPT|nr:CLUMA_CG002907, isoform A [Clunio marinus]
MSIEKKILCITLLVTINLSGITCGGNSMIFTSIDFPSNPCADINFDGFEALLNIIEEFMEDILKLAEDIIDELDGVPNVDEDEGAASRLLNLIEMVEQLLDAVKKFNDLQTPLLAALDSLLICNEERVNQLLDETKVLNPTLAVLNAIKALNAYLNGGDVRIGFDSIDVVIEDITNEAEQNLSQIFIYIQEAIASVMTVLEGYLSSNTP